MANASCSNCTLISNVLTLVGSVSGTVVVGMTLTGASVPPGVTITSNGTGSGGAGTYNCSASAANISTGEPMVFSLSWDMPLQGNSGFPQLADLGRAAGFGFVIAASIPGPSAGPGQQYTFGTHAVAIYNETAVQGTNVWPPSPGRQGPSVAPTILTLPQYPEPRDPKLFDVSPLEKSVGNQPLHLITAAPQNVDLTLQPWLTQPFQAQSNAWTAQYQFGTHAAQIYNSQGGTALFPTATTPPVTGGQSPLRTIVTLPQELSRDLTLQGWSKIPSVKTGWLLTMVTAGPQLADLTLQAQFIPARPFLSPFSGPISPKTIVSVSQDDTTQIAAKFFAPPLRKPAVQPLALQVAAPDRQNFTQPQGLVIQPSLPGPSKKLQPAFVWAFEQQYDKNLYPQVFTQPVVFIPPPPSTGFRVMAVTAGFYDRFRTPGDVFDIRSANDFSDSSVDYQATYSILTLLNGNTLVYVNPTLGSLTMVLNPPSVVGYGWMRKVPNTTPLFDWLQSNGAPYLPPQDPLRRFIY